MNIKALPSVGSAFFVAFVLWSRRFAVPLQKESLGGALGGALVSSAPTEQEVHQQSKKCANRATLVHLRQVHPLKAPLKAPLKVANKNSKTNDIKIHNGMD